MAAGGREYLLTASAVRHNEGLVLLLQDVTERNASEKARKRFTANVSHELRTPLTTISGYAELMQSGMTEPADIPVFARKIYNESRRLLQLIEDIMHLSKLDEGFVSGRLERVDLLEAARAAVGGKRRNRRRPKYQREPLWRKRLDSCRRNAPGRDAAQRHRKRDQV